MNQLANPPRTIRVPGRGVAGIVVGLALVAAACGGGGDSGERDTEPGLATTIPTVVTTTTAPAETTTVPVTTSLPADAETEVADMVAAANADGTVTAEEITEILEATEVPPTEAECQAAVLAEVGVTDPTDPQQLADASASLTADQRARLGACITGAG